MVIIIVFFAAGIIAQIIQAAVFCMEYYSIMQ
jgi:hypothetical protein